MLLQTGLISTFPTSKSGESIAITICALDLMLIGICMVSMHEWMGGWVDETKRQTDAGRQTWKAIWEVGATDRQIGRQADGRQVGGWTDRQIGRQADGRQVGGWTDRQIGRQADGRRVGGWMDRQVGRQADRRQVGGWTDRQIGRQADGKQVGGWSRDGRVSGLILFVINIAVCIQTKS